MALLTKVGCTLRAPVSDPSPSRDARKARPNPHSFSYDLSNTPLIEARVVALSHHKWKFKDK